MAALRQNHRGALGGVAPVAAYKAVRHVPPTDILAVRNIDNLAQNSRLDDLAHLHEVRRKAQHMTDVKLPSGFFGSVSQLTALIGGSRHWFFEQHVVTGAQRGQRGGGVLLVLRADERGLPIVSFF